MTGFSPRASNQPRASADTGTAAPSTSRPTPDASASWCSPSARPSLEIDARAGGPVPSQQEAEADARLRLEEGGLAGPQATTVPEAGRERLQSGGRRADVAAHPDLVAGARAGPGEHPPPPDGAEGRHVEDERARRTRDVPTDQCHAVRRREGHEPVDDRVEIGERQARRQHERQQGGTGGRAHRGEVAQVHRQCAVADRSRRRECPVEMHALDQRVGRHHVEGVALRLDHRGIVAQTDRDPGWRRRHVIADARDEGVLADVGDAIWRTQRRGSRESPSP